MAEEKNNNFALIALVAIVAVVGLVVLMRGAGTSAQPIVLEKQAFASGPGNVGGQAYASGSDTGDVKYGSPMSERDICLCHPCGWCYCDTYECVPNEKDKEDTKLSYAD